MLSLSKTPVKLSRQELLSAAAASLLFKRLSSLAVMKRVADVCQKPQYGHTESASQDPVGPRFVRITDIRAGKIDWDTVPYCRCDDAESFLLRPGDILVGRTGSVGKS